MAIEKLSDEQLRTFINNYRKREATEGGKYSLSELLCESGRRAKTPFPPHVVAQVIVEKARSSKDGLVTYKQVWSEFRPDEEWKGNASQTEIAQALARTIIYCVDHGLPIVTTLVVRTDSRGHTPQAEQHIYDEAHSLGVDVGLSAKDFVARQAEQARQLVERDLPGET